ncbi:hypothetical protein Bbelb_308430 [Branchiostoma belcheri]|nr:hypothetical protein Bbelb_308430 [Branchiostoma belcheri]
MTDVEGCGSLLSDNLGANSVSSTSPVPGTGALFSGFGIKSSAPQQSATFLTISRGGKKKKSPKKMKTAILFLALLAGAKADFWSDLWDGVQTNLLDPVVDAAQLAAQGNSFSPIDSWYRLGRDTLESRTRFHGRKSPSPAGVYATGESSPGGVLGPDKPLELNSPVALVDTYVPVLGQAAQQLVGEAVQSAGDALTSLVSGKRKRQLLTELGQIIQDGFDGLTGAVQQAVDSVTQTVQGELSNLINGLTGTTGSRGKMLISGVKSKFTIRKRSKEMQAKMAGAVQKMARARGFFDDLTAAASSLFAPAIQQAQNAFQTLVDAATATGAAILDHGSQLVQNVQTSLQQTYDQILGVTQPYIDDATQIVASIQNQFDTLVGGDATTA